MFKLPKFALLPPAAMLLPPRLKVPLPTLVNESRPPTNGLITLPVKVVFVLSKPVTKVEPEKGL